MEQSEDGIFALSVNSKWKKEGRHIFQDRKWYSGTWKSEDVGRIVDDAQRTWQHPALTFSSPPPSAPQVSKIAMSQQLLLRRGGVTGLANRLMLML